ncbi:UDP-N-acetylmuramate dehydrogenase [Nocardioides sp. IC4_145]|uniref:UDP-N-acetylmuramate dehydrogenase n=1 Tax=Nocardioides sp. IC4_145 TaxID=2714037 RepID=UPI00140D08DA|nr:UDP-N-acetylmuramate dehydrogenase [Nocardioides sp. IC4_145]
MPEPAPGASALLRDHTTLRLGGPAGELVVATTEEELVAALDADGPVLVLGGGSNLVVADDGFAGRVVKIATTGIAADTEDDDPSCGGVLVTVAAGESWDHLVEVAAERGWVGVEALSGIPGSVGATPVQNVGAYGQEVSQTIASVRVWDRVLKGVRTFANADCHFAYRHSRFKADPGRHVVLSVTFQLRQGTLGAPVQYAELARALGVDLGQRAPLREVREAVLALRRGKGMVLDDADPDTWSAGSFFTNPIVPAEQVPEGAPAWPAGDGLVKTSAAWLIDHAGFGKGYAAGRVSLSTKHALALTNRGDATTEELLALAREVRDGVQAAYGIRLVNEPVLVGCEL